MTTCIYGIEGCNCWAASLDEGFDPMLAAAELDAGFTVVNFEPGLPFPADLLAALLVTDEELVALGLLPNEELEWSLGEVEAGNLLSTDEAGVLAEEIYRLEERERELTEALAEAEADVDALSAEKAELAEDLNDLAVENILVWLANAELKDLLDISLTLNAVGATELARVSQQFSLALEVIDAQAAELRRYQTGEVFKARRMLYSARRTSVLGQR